MYGHIQHQGLDHTKVCKLSSTQPQPCGHPWGRAHPTTQPELHCMGPAARSLHAQLQGFTLMQVISRVGVKRKGFFLIYIHINRGNI